MAKDNTKFIKGIEIKEESSLNNKVLEITVDATAVANKKAILKSAHQDDRTITLPDATDTLVGKATTDVLTNKSIDDDNNVITNLALTGIKTVIGQADKFLSRDGSGVVIDTKAVPVGDVIGSSDTQVLTNKTIDGTSGTGTNTIAIDAADAVFDNGASGLAATTVQAALDEIDGSVDGKVTGPASATDNALVRYDGTTGKLVQTSGSTLDDSGNMTIQNKLTVLGDLQVDGTTTTFNTATVDVEDANITLNKNGNQATADDTAGLTIEMSDATDVRIIYDKDVPSRFRAGDVGSEVQLVNVSSAQTLTNKTLTSPAISTPTGLVKGDVGLGNVDNTSDATKNSAVADLANKTFTNPIILEEQGSSPSTPPSGDRKLYSKTDGKLYHMGNDGVEKIVGSGSGGINYHSDFDCDNIAKVTLYNTGGATPTTGTGGTADVTKSLETSAPLSGTSSYKLSKDALSRQGQGWSILSDTLFKVEKDGNNVWISFNYSTSANYVSGDVTAYIYRVGSNTLEALNSFQGTSFTNSLPAAPNSSSYTGWTTASSTDTNIRVILHVATVNNLAYDILLDRLTIGPNAKVQSAIMSDWESFTPTGTWTTNTTYTGKWRRVGSDMEIEYKVALSGTPTATALILNVPSGYTIDNTLLTSTAYDNVVGIGNILDYDGSAYGLTTVFYSTTAVVPLFNIDSNQGSMSGVTHVSPISLVNLDKISIRVKVPILGWKSGNTMSTSELAVRSAAARVTKNGTQAVSGETKLTSWTVSKDNMGMWDAINNRFNVPNANWYDLHINVHCPPATTATQVSGYKVNGGTVVWFSNSSSSSNVSRFTGGTVIYLNKNDYVEIIHYSDNAATVQAGAEASAVLAARPDLTVIGVNGVNEILTAKSTGFVNWPIAGNTWGDITSIVVPVGVWDFNLQLGAYSNGATTTNYINIGLGTVSLNNAPGADVFGVDTLGLTKSTSASSGDSLSYVKRGVVVTTPTTFYFKAIAGTSITNLQEGHAMYARRIS